ANEDLPPAMRRLLSEAELQDVAARSERLRMFQERPDSLEMLRRLSFVKREDLRRVIAVTPLDAIIAGGASAFRYNRATPGIAFLDMGFGLGSLSAAHLPYVRVFSRALLGNGTRASANIRPVTLSSAISGSRGAAAWLFLRAKLISEDADEMFAFLRNLI